MFRREEGQTMAEYSVVLGMIVIVTVAAFVAVGTGAAGLYDKVTAILT
jgi:Flp pilus assembly pilin Flp